MDEDPHLLPPSTHMRGSSGAASSPFQGEENKWFVRYPSPCKGEVDSTKRSDVESGGGQALRSFEILNLRRGAGRSRRRILGRLCKRIRLFQGEDSTNRFFFSLR